MSLDQDADTAARVAQALTGAFRAGQRVKSTRARWYGTVTEDNLPQDHWVGVLWDNATVPSCEAVHDVEPVKSRRNRAKQ